MASLERHPINRKVVGFIPGQGTCLGCSFIPRTGHVLINVSHVDVSLSPSILLSLKSISMSSSEDFKKIY